MSWWGKLIGGTLGFTMGGPLGLLIGGYLGHRFVDNKLAGAFERLEYTQAAFFTATFAVMGYLAKADGRVTKDEIDMANQVMNHMNLNPEQRKAAIDLFNQGKSEGFDVDAVMIQFKELAYRQTNLQQMFLEIQMHAVYADGGKHPAEHAILIRLADILGFSQQRLLQIEAMIQANLYGMSGSNPRSYEEQIKDAYEILGIEQTASAAEVKKSYRRLMSQHHPDKLVSKGLPEEMMKLANEKTQQIKKAYDLVKKHLDNAA